MMNITKNTNHLLLALIFVLFTACNEEEIIPSDSNYLVEFPQGENTYDKEIKDFYDQYGTQILYRYDDAMFRWQITDRLGFFSKPADETSISEALQFVKQNCFDFYQPDMLKRLLPYRIYLASDLGRIFIYTGLDASGKNVNVKDTIWHTIATNGYANLCFAVASKRMSGLSLDSLRLAKGELNASLLAYAIEQHQISIPNDFIKEEVANVAWYNYVGSYNTYGLLEYIDPKTFSPAQDFVLFLKYLIAYPMETFEAKFTNKTFDTSGRIARKAKTVREWMKVEYNIDIDAMSIKEI